MWKSFEMWKLPEMWKSYEMWKSSEIYLNWSKKILLTTNWVNLIPLKNTDNDDDMSNTLNFLS